MNKSLVFALLFSLTACGGSVELPQPDERPAPEASASDAVPDVPPVPVDAPDAEVDAGTDDADCCSNPTMACKGGCRDAAPDAPTAVCCQVGSTQTQIACAQDDAGAWSFECVYPNRISLTCLPSQCQLGAECTAGDGGVVVPCAQ